MIDDISIWHMFPLDWFASQPSEKVRPVSVLEGISIVVLHALLGKLQRCQYNLLEELTTETPLTRTMLRKGLET